MEWRTIYIVGKDGFGEEVRKNLERSDFQFMAGYHTGDVTEMHELFWIPEQAPVRSVKKAIGAKTVFKYRLRFFTSLEDFIQTLHKPEGFTQEEIRRMQRMRAD